MHSLKLKFRRGLLVQYHAQSWQRQIAQQRPFMSFMVNESVAGFLCADKHIDVLNDEAVGQKTKLAALSL